MKLVRYGPAGKEKPGLIDADGKLRDLSRKVKDIDGATLAPAELAKLRKLDTKQAAAGEGQAAPGPVRRDAVEVRRDRLELHRSRQGNRLADSRVSDRLLQGADLHRRPQRQRHAAAGLDAHRLGSRARHRHRPHRALRRRVKDALKYVAGYCVINDVSERDYQMKRSAIAMEQGQGLRHLRPARAVAGDHRRDQGPAESRHVARRQRRAPADAATRGR